MNHETRLTIQLFAAAREAAGRDRIEVVVRLPVTIAELRRSILDQFPQLGVVLDYSRMAVNRQYALDTDRIQEEVELAVIPPVSGG